MFENFFGEIEQFHKQKIPVQDYLGNCTIYALVFFAYFRNLLKDSIHCVNRPRRDTPIFVLFFVEFSLSQFEAKFLGKYWKLDNDLY